MRKRTLTIGAFVAAAVAVALVALSQSASATPTTSVSHDCKPGYQQNFVTKIEARPDSGQAGNNWAYDSFVRKTSVTTDCQGSFDVKIVDHGKFTTIPGERSPGDGANLPRIQCTGSFDGGAHATIKSDQKFPKNPGSYSPGDKSTTEWLGLLFPGTDAQLDQWGWSYKLSGETWTNALSGNSGDVTGKYCKPEHKPPFRVELSIPSTACDGAVQATALLTVKVYGKHPNLNVPYWTSDSQHGFVIVKWNQNLASKELTFPNGAGDGTVYVKLWFGKLVRKAEVGTKCTTPTSTTTVPPTTTTTTTTPPTSTTTSNDATVVPAGNVGSGPRQEVGDLAYTGTSDKLPTILWIGLIALAVGGLLLLLFRQRSRRSGSHRQS